MDRASSREIRVFLSSTFKDMEAERDYLLTKVFPEVRQKCAERSVGFTEIDLRWGVTEEESQNGKTVEICLQEIDRCRDFPPFFIGFLGERYGWIPTAESLDSYWRNCHDSKYEKAIHQALKKGISVTELEFDFGISGYDEITPETLFYLRSPELTDSLYQKSGEEDKTCFYDSGNGRLNDLKRKLRKYGRLTIDNYTSVEAFGESVKQNLLDALERLYPSDEVDTPYQKREHAHRMFAQSRRSTYIPLPEERDTVVSYLDHRLSQREKRPLLISGESGLGKSALMADLAVYLKERMPNALIIDRYIGADGDRSVDTWRDDLLEFCLKDQPEGTELPDTSKDRWEALSAWLYTTANNHQKQIILILDAINQCYDPLDSIQQLQQVVWPENVALVLSSTPDVQVVDSLWKHHQLAALNSEQRAAMVKAYAANFRKGLPAYLIEQLITHTGSELPLYTRLILEELRLHSSHESLEIDLSKMLKHDSVQPLFRQVVQKLDEDFSTEQHPNIVSKLVSFLAVSRVGLDELELAGLLANQSDPISPVTDQPSLPAAKLSPMLAMLWPYLLRQDGRQRIMHNALIESVLGLEDEVSLRNELIDYFKGENGCAVAERLHQKLALVGDADDSSDQLEPLVDELALPNQLVACFEEDRDLLGRSLRRIGAGRGKASSIIEAVGKQWNNVQAQNWPMGAFHIGIYLSESSFLKLGVAWSEAQLKFYREEFFDDYEGIAFALHNLASLYESIGRLDDVETLYLEALSIFRSSLPSNHAEKIGCLNSLANFLQSHYRLDEAESLLLEALSIRDQLRSKDQRWIADTLKILARLRSSKFHFDEAESLFLEALSIYRKLLPAGHVKIAECLTDLASFYCSRNCPVEAESLYVESIAICRQSYPEGHPAIATHLNNLSRLYALQDKLDKAEPLFEEALTIVRQSLPKEHPVYASSIYNQALFFKSQNRLDEVEFLLLEALSIRRKIFSKNHPEVANTLNSLALFYGEQNRLDEAEALCLEALSIQRKLFPEGHPNIAKTLTCLGSYIWKNHPEKIESLLLEALSINRQSLPVGHSDIAESLNNLALFYSEQDRLDEVETLYLDALSIVRRSFPTEHPHIAEILNNLALFYAEHGRLDDARPLYVEALSIMRKSRPTGTPFLAKLLYNFAVFYGSKNSFHLAEPLYVEALLIARKFLPERHPDIVKILNGVASFYGAYEKPDKVEALLIEALSIGRKSLPVEHLDLAVTLSDLAFFYAEQNRLDEAEALFVEALSIRRKLMPLGHPLLESSLKYLADVYVAQYQFNEAGQLYLEALDCRLNGSPDGYQYITEIIAALISIYTKEEKFSDAKSLTNKTLAILYDTFPKRHESVKWFEKVLEN